MLNGLLTLLNDTKALTTYAQEIIEGRSNDSVLDALVKPEKPKKQAKSKAKSPTQNGNRLESLGLW
jgi:hypothetical protein